MQLGGKASKQRLIASSYRAEAIRHKTNKKRNSLSQSFYISVVFFLRIALQKKTGGRVQRRGKHNNKATKLAGEREKTEDETHDKEGDASGAQGKEERKREKQRLPSPPTRPQARQEITGAVVERQSLYRHQGSEQRTSVRRNRHKTDGQSESSSRKKIGKERKPTEEASDTYTNNLEVVPRLFRLLKVEGVRRRGR